MACSQAGFALDHTVCGFSAPTVPADARFEFAPTVTDNGGGNGQDPRPNTVLAALTGGNDNDSGAGSHGSTHLAALVLLAVLGYRQRGQRR